MPMYESPPESLSGGSSSRFTSPSRSKSYSPASSPDRGLSKRSTRNRDDDKGDSHVKSGVKESLLFLGTIAAATFAVHKYWPRGVMYGDKNEWEEEQHEKKAKRSAQKAQNERRSPGRSSSRSDRSSSSVTYADREERRARYREGGREYSMREFETQMRGDPDRRRDLSDQRSPAPAQSGASRRSISRGRPAPLPVERQSVSYYPPAPRRRYYEEDAYPAPVYAPRDAPSKSRRQSLDRSSRRGSLDGRGVDY